MSISITNTNTAAVLPPLRRYVAPTTGRFTGPAAAATAPVTELYRRHAAPVAHHEDAVPAHLLDAALHLIDPQVKSGKLPVTLRQTTATRGRRDWLAAHTARDDLPRDLSVCCLFQDGRCKAAAGCRQIHVDRSVIAALRAERMHLVSCCLKCGDDASAAMPEAQRLFARFAESGCRWAALEGLATAGMPQLKMSQLAFTPGLAALLADQLRAMSADRPMAIPWSAVCRLHLKASCKYGRDCKNVHLCSKIGALLLSRAAANVNAVVPTSIAQQAEECANTSFELTPSKTEADEKKALSRAGSVTSTDDEALIPTVHAAPAPLTAPAPLMQPRAPAALRDAFPVLDEGSLRVRDVDLDSMTFLVDGLLNLASPAPHASSKFSVSPPSVALQRGRFSRQSPPSAHHRVGSCCAVMSTPHGAAAPNSGASPQSTTFGSAVKASPMTMAHGDLFGAQHASPQSVTAWQPSPAQRLF
jgi:hypothetical protein